MRREASMNGETENSNVESQDRNWMKLWKVRVPPKLRLFAWRLARSSLPTGEERTKRHMTTSPVCSICSAAYDSWRHALLDCNMAKCVWALRDDDSCVALYGDETPDAKLWLFGLFSTLSSHKVVEVLVTLWSIWYARRRAMHENEFQSPLSTHLFINRYLDELKGHDSMSPKCGPTSKPAAPKWIDPPSSWKHQTQCGCSSGQIHQQRSCGGGMPR